MGHFSTLIDRGAIVYYNRGAIVYYNRGAIADYNLQDWVAGAMEQRLYTSPTSRVVKTILEVGNYLIMSAKGSIIAAFTFCTKLIFIIYINLNILTL